MKQTHNSGHYRNIILTVPSTNSLSYTWALNGTVHPEWGGLNEIDYTPTTSGNQIFEVFASTTGDAVCQGPSSTFEVFVFDALDRPILEITRVGCDPY